MSNVSEILYSVVVTLQVIVQAYPSLLQLAWYSQGACSMSGMSKVAVVRNESQLFNNDALKMSKLPHPCHFFTVLL